MKKKPQSLFNWSHYSTWLNWLPFFSYPWYQSHTKLFENMHIDCYFSCLNIVQIFLFWSVMSNSFSFLLGVEEKFLAVQKSVLNIIRNDDIVLVWFFNPLAIPWISCCMHINTTFKKGNRRNFYVFKKWIVWDRCEEGYWDKMESTPKVRMLKSCINLKWREIRNYLSIHMHIYSV